MGGGGGGGRREEEGVRREEGGGRRRRDAFSLRSDGGRRGREEEGGGGRRGEGWEGRLEGRLVESRLKRPGFKENVLISRKICFSLGLRSLLEIKVYMGNGYSMGLFVREATLPSNNLVRLRSLVMIPLVMS